MAVKQRCGDFYLYFRPFKTKQIGLKVDVSTKTEARQLEAILTRACRTRNYAGLDGAAREACLRMFENQGWELPADLGDSPSYPKEKLTLWKACELFLRYPEIRAKTPKALASYTQALINLASFLGKDVPINELWIPNLKSYQIERLNQGAAPSTINTELSALSRVFAVMIEMQAVSVNPVRLVKRLSTKSNEREVYLSRRTVKVIADKCPAWYQRIIWTAYFSGMRRGEILSLTRRQVNLSKRMIHLGPEDTKESRRKRVPIHHELVPILEEAMRTPFLASDKVFLVHDAQELTLLGTRGRELVKPWRRPRN